MKETTNAHRRTEFLKAILVGSSVLGAAGHFLNNETFFLVFGLLCTLLVCGLSVFAVVTSPKATLPILLLYGVIFSLEMVIGCLCTDSVGDGLLLGCCFIGLSIVVLSRLIDWSHDYLMRNTPADDEDDEDELEPILLDESLPAEERIASMSLAFDRMDTVFSDLEEAVEVIRHNSETMKALERYMDSGLWQRDFEAMERGEVDPECDLFGVLSEDGLYNLLESSKDVLIEAKDKKQESEN
jgi:hypothetical protein